MVNLLETQEIGARTEVYDINSTMTAVRPKEIGAPNSWAQVYDINNDLKMLRGRGTPSSPFSGALMGVEFLRFTS